MNINFVIFEEKKTDLVNKIYKKFYSWPFVYTEKNFDFPYFMGFNVNLIIFKVEKNLINKKYIKKFIYVYQQSLEFPSLNSFF